MEMQFVVQGGGVGGVMTVVAGVVTTVDFSTFFFSLSFLSEDLSPLAGSLPP